MPVHQSSIECKGRGTSSKLSKLPVKESRLLATSADRLTSPNLRSHGVWSERLNRMSQKIDGDARLNSKSGMRRKKASPHLPDEIWESILLHLCRRDVASLSSVCRRMNWLCIPHIWKNVHLHIRSNGNESLSELASTVARRTEIGEEIQRLTITSLGPKSPVPHTFHSKDSICEATRSHFGGEGSDAALFRTWSEAVTRHDTDAVLALILTCLPNLKELSFQYADLDPSHSKCAAQFVRLPFTRLHLPMLRHLRIHHQTCNAAFVEALLNSSPINLSSISLTGDYADPTDYSLYGDEITPSLSTCLSRFAPFLQSLELHTSTTDYRDLEHYRTSIPRSLDLPSFSDLVNLRISTSDLLRENPASTSFSELPRLALLLPPNITYLHVIDPVNSQAGAHMTRVFFEELVQQGSTRMFSSLLSIVLEGQWWINTMCLVLAAECKPPLHFIQLKAYATAYGGGYSNVDPPMDCPPWPVPVAMKPPQDRIIAETGFVARHLSEEETYKEEDEDLGEMNDHDDEDEVAEMQFITMSDHYDRDMRVMNWFRDHFDHADGLEDKILDVPDELRHLVLS